MSQSKYSGRLKGYNLITLKTIRPMAHDIMVSIQKTYKAKRKSYRWKKKCLLRPACSLKYAVCFPSNNNKMGKIIAA
jgi:hypothetical protein